MAQDTWINVTIDPAASSRPNPTSHVHTAKGGTAAASDFTISLDSAKVGNLAVFDTAVAAARVRMISAGLK